MGRGVGRRARGGLVVFAEDGADVAVAVGLAEVLVEAAVGEFGFVGPAAFGEPEGTFHDELHGVDILEGGGDAGEDDVEVLVGFGLEGEVAELEEAVHQDGEDDDVVGVEGLACVGEEARGAGDFVGDGLEGVGIEEVVGVEVEDVVAGGFTDAAVAEGVSEVVVAGGGGGDGDGEVE